MKKGLGKYRFDSLLVMNALRLQKCESLGFTLNITRTNAEFALYIYRSQNTM